MKFEWNFDHRFLMVPLQKDIEDSEIHFFADGVEVSARNLPLARTRIDAWRCIDLYPLDAKQTYGIDVQLDNLWMRLITASPDKSLLVDDQARNDPIIHYVSNQAKAKAVYGLAQAGNGTWLLRVYANVLGESQEYVDSVLLESPDLLDWKVSHVNYNLPQIRSSERPQERVWQGAVKEEFSIPYRHGELTIAISEEMEDWPFSSIFSIPLFLHENTLEPADYLRKLRIWERKWKNIRTSRYFEKFSFRVAPGHWPNIRILEAEGAPSDISAQAFEVILDIECSPAQQLNLEICGFPIRVAGQRIWNHEHSIPAQTQAGTLRLTFFVDKTIAEVICGGQALLMRQNSQDRQTINVDNSVSGNVGGCKIDVAPGKEIRIESTSEFTLHAVTLYGLRSCRFGPEARSLLEKTPAENPIFYKGATFTVYSRSVNDSNYGYPDAYILDEHTVVSPLRITEEFQWRDTKWGDMVRAINRKEIWRPVYDHGSYPRLCTSVASVNAAYEIALDIFSACKSEEFALPSEAGLWSAGLFQGPGEGFGVWVRDSAHIALRCGNLLDPLTARKTLLYTTRNGFDNGSDGPAMAIVGLWDYYLATHDRFAIQEAWPFLLEKIQDVEARFSDETGLVRAEQSTSNDAFEEPENDGFCLSTECYFQKAYWSMAQIATLLGFDPEKVKHWRARANQLRETINQLYWNEDFGYYTSGPKGSQSFAEGYWETSGAESVIWSKFSIADQERSWSVLKHLRTKAMTDFGIQLFPDRPEKNHFCGSVWVVWEAGFADAAATQRDVDLVHTLIGQQVRNCVINKTFYEVIDASSGLAWRWPGQLWQAAGFVSLLFYGLFGIRYDEQGFHTRPVVPAELKNARLENLRYGNATIDIIIEGYGTEGEMFIDGTKAERIPWHITGKHEVRLRMKDK
ncbi:MAG: hypothetical protein JNM55_23270 [Anaerolineales bacterium]|nr:hypothetical protein [Anaerolineales bacterium]